MMFRPWRTWIAPELKLFPKGECAAEAWKRATKDMQRTPRSTFGILLGMLPFIPIAVACFTLDESYRTLKMLCLVAQSVLAPMVMYWFASIEIRRSLRSLLNESSMKILCVECGYLLYQPTDVDARCPECGKSKADGVVRVAKAERMRKNINLCMIVFVVLGLAIAVLYAMF